MDQNSLCAGCFMEDENSGCTHDPENEEELETFCCSSCGTHVVRDMVSGVILHEGTLGSSDNYKFTGGEEPPVPNCKKIWVEHDEPTTQAMCSACIRPWEKND